MASHGSSLNSMQSCWTTSPCTNSFSSVSCQPFRVEKWGILPTSTRQQFHSSPNSIRESANSLNICHDLPKLLDDLPTGSVRQWQTWPSFFRMALWTVSRFLSTVWHLWQTLSWMQASYQLPNAPWMKGIVRNTAKQICAIPFYWMFERCLLVEAK